MNVDRNLILIAILVILAAIGFFVSIRAYKKDKASLGNLVGGISILVTIGIFLYENSASDAKEPARAEVTTSVPEPAANAPEPAAKPAQPAVQPERAPTQRAAQSEPVQNTSAATAPRTDEKPVQVAPTAPAAPSAGDLSASDAYQTGKSAAQNGNYRKAAEYYQSAADRGSSAAAYELALLYQRGNGVAKNEPTAFRYMKAAADAGYAQAFRPLGEMYHGGRGVAKDRNMAAEWYKKAVELGDETAKKILYNM